VRGEEGREGDATAGEEGEGLGEAVAALCGRPLKMEAVEPAEEPVMGVDGYMIWRGDGARKEGCERDEEREGGRSAEEERRVR
jgi:hypothetical protein